MLEVHQLQTEGKVFGGGFHEGQLRTRHYSAIGAQQLQASAPRLASKEELGSLLVAGFARHGSDLDPLQGFAESTLLDFQIDGHCIPPFSLSQPLVDGLNLGFFLTKLGLQCSDPVLEQFLFFFEGGFQSLLRQSLLLEAGSE